MKDTIIKLVMQSNMTFEKLQSITNIDPNELERILLELMDDKTIFLSTSKKYEFLRDEYLVGTLEKTSKDLCYVVVDGKKYYIKPSELHTALKNDLVVIEEQFDSFATIRGILKRKNNKLVCEVREWNNRLVLVPFNGNCEIHLITPTELMKDLIIGDRVYVTLNNESSDENYIVVRDLTKIGHFNDKFNDEISIAISKDFDIDFSEEAIKEAEAIPKTVQEDEKKGRLDLTEENIFTIDSVHTKDMDDAISIKKLPNGNYQLGVHIADVAHYIKPGTHLFKEAMKRGVKVDVIDRSENASKNKNRTH